MRGIAHHNLAFDDCQCPALSDHVVAEFFTVADAAKGAVAVHCMGGLGLTLIALYMMRSHEFGALEAMGWLHMVCPCPFSGEQQRYLCAAERRTARMRAVLAAVRLAQAGPVPRGFRVAFLPAAGRRRHGSAASVAG